MLREMARFYPASVVVISRLSAFFDFSQALLFVSSPPARLIFCSVSRSLSLSPPSPRIFLSDTALSQIFSHNNPYFSLFLVFMNFQINVLQSKRRSEILKSVSLLVLSNEMSFLFWVVHSQFINCLPHDQICLEKFK